ncbi:hypothetical protein EYF80_018772 [Liparis tanakae]|uniref:Uncharacterized protein n=1 Tax=Liparis tanakae TaxID=230148 RepID=A0A4Z2HYP1_9TELE|nr:hypothetical protein EYF80_018772 [Liparis tanakae]
MKLRRFVKLQKQGVEPCQALLLRRLLFLTHRQHNLTWRTDKRRNSHSSQHELHGGSLQQQRVGVELPHFTLDARLLGLEHELNPPGVTWTNHTWMRRGIENVTQGRRGAVKTG